MNLRQRAASGQGQGKDAVYEVERVIAAKEDREALQRAVEGPGLESEQVLRLTIDGDRSSTTRSGLTPCSRKRFGALPRGCVVANLYPGRRATCACGSASTTSPPWRGCATTSSWAQRSRTRSQNCAALGAARDGRRAPRHRIRSLRGDRPAGVLSERRASNSKFEDAPTVPEAEARIRVDRGEFMECYARLMMRFSKLTPHQREKLEEARAQTAKVAVLLAPAGGGKTFVAIQRVVEVLNEDPAATVLFVARNKALALFVCKWLVVASRKAVSRVVERVHVLVAPFEDGPRRVRVDEATGARRRLVVDATRAEAVTYALIVVDEAHHLVDDGPRCRAARGAWRCRGKPVPRRRLAGDGSDATLSGGHCALAGGNGWQPLECFDPTLTDQDLEIKVIDDPDELQRLCERPAPGAVEAVGWDEDMAEMRLRQSRIYKVNENTCSYGILTRGDILVRRSSGKRSRRDEVVRSTQRIVAGAAAFQLEAGRKAETSTHTASTGPPLVARIFTTSEGDDAGDIYAREVVEAIAAIRRQLVDLEDLDDRVAVVGPDDAFVREAPRAVGAWP